MGYHDERHPTAESVRSVNVRQHRLTTAYILATVFGVVVNLAIPYVSALWRLPLVAAVGIWISWKVCPPVHG